MSWASSLKTVSLEVNFKRPRVLPPTIVTKFNEASSEPSDTSVAVASIWTAVVTSPASLSKRN